MTMKVTFLNFVTSLFTFFFTLILSSTATLVMMDTVHDVSTLHHFYMNIKVTVLIFAAILITFTLTLTLPSSVTLVTQDMMSDRPTFLSFNSTIQDQGAVLTLETAWVKIPIHSPDPRSLGLTLLWHNWLGADAA